jgi:MFS family permease
MACITGFGLGSLLLVIATNYESLLLGRAIQGLGASGIFPVAAAVIGDTFPKEKQGGALGLIGAVFGLAFLIGPVLGGILLRYAWQWLFLINLPIAAGLLLAAWRLLPASGSKAQLPFDWLGGGVLTVLLFGIAVAVTNLDTATISISIRSLQVWPFLLVGVLLLPVFWRLEQHAPDPIIRPAFFESRQIRLVMMIAAGLGSVECAQVFFPALGVAGLGVTESMAAWLMLPGVFVMMIVSPLAGKVVDAIGPTRVIQGALAITLAGLLVYTLTEITYVTFIGGGMIVGVGVAALLGAPLRYILLEEARPEDRAATQGLLNIFLAIGQLSGAAIVGAVATSAGGGSEGYQLSFGVLAAITVVICGVALGLKYAPQAKAGAPG